MADRQNYKLVSLKSAFYICMLPYRTCILKRFATTISTTFE